MRTRFRQRIPTQPSLKRWFLSMVLVSGGLTVGCSGSTEPPAVEPGKTDGSILVGDEGGTGDGATGTTTNDIVGKVCNPGEFKACTQDFRGAVNCADDGLGYETQPCVGFDGKSSICNNELGCLACKPHQTRCKNDLESEECGPDGFTWIPKEKCSQFADQVCDQGPAGGSCVKLCFLADKDKSYMGCEFWGADLDNAFVPGGSRGYYDAAGAQYSIVVSNPHPSRTVEVN